MKVYLAVNDFLGSFTGQLTALKIPGLIHTEDGIWENSECLPCEVNSNFLKISANVYPIANYTIRAGTQFCDSVEMRLEDIAHLLNYLAKQNWDWLEIQELLIQKWGRIKPEDIKKAYSGGDLRG